MDYLSLLSNFNSGKAAGESDRQRSFRIKAYENLPSIPESIDNGIKDKIWTVRRNINFRLYTSEDEGVSKSPDIDEDKQLTKNSDDVLTSMKKKVKRITGMEALENATNEVLYKRSGKSQ
jgi:hypothetical protein